MKKLMLLLICCWATMMVSAQKKEMNELLFATETLRLAMISGDKASLMQLTAETLSYGHSSGVVENKQQFVDKLVSGASDFVTINISEQQVEIYKSTAIVRHTLQATTNDNGKAGTVHLHILQVWVKEKNGWLLAARQAVKKI